MFPVNEQMNLLLPEAFYANAFSSIFLSNEQITYKDRTGTNRKNYFFPLCTYKC